MYHVKEIIEGRNETDTSSFEDRVGKFLKGMQERAFQLVEIHYAVDQNGNSRVLIIGESVL